jgi:hypothetical protein
MTHPPSVTDYDYTRSPTFWADKCPFCKRVRRDCREFPCASALGLTKDRDGRALFKIVEVEA